MTQANNPTENRVYGGADNLIHIADGERRYVGCYLAETLDYEMRLMAVAHGTRTQDQAYGNRFQSPHTPRQNLCPGCYMVAVVAMAVELAHRNGQSLTELGNSLSDAFAAIAKDGVDERNMEWIDVRLDPEPGSDADVELAWNRATFGGYPL